MNGFSVPIHLKDLEIGGGKYVVDGDKAAAGAPKDAKEQRQEIERIRAELETSGAPSVVAEFDALYVLTRDAEQLDAQAARHWPRSSADGARRRLRLRSPEARRDAGQGGLG